MMRLADLAIQSSLIAALGLAACVVFRHKAAALRHWVLALAFACMAALPALGAVVPAWSIPFVAGRFASGGGSATAVSAGNQSLVSERQEPFPGASAPMGRGAQTPQAGGDDSAALVGLRSSLVALWAAGTLGSLLIVIAGLARLRWWTARAGRIEGGDWRELACEVSRRHGLRREVLLLHGDHPGLLVTWGLLRPRILLPRHADTWGRERIEIALAHELGHVRRGDWAVQLAALIVRCVYWFNPLVWVAYGRLVREGEHACDDDVLNLGIDVRAYVTQLLEIARASGSSRPACSAAPAMIRVCSLERRVRAMLTPETNRRPVPARVLAACAAAILAFAIPVAGFQAIAGSYSRVSGAVVDPHGRPLAEIAVVLSNSEDRSKYEVRSRDDGRFEFAAVPPGEYVLSAERFGFKRFEHRLAVGGRAVHQDIVMSVGTVQETIVVARGDTAAAVGRNVHSMDVEITEADRRRLQAAQEACAAATDPAAGGDIRPPLKVKHVAPDYPDYLQSSGVTGVVELTARIAADGQVAGIEPASRDVHPDLTASAIAAVSQWQFEPTLLNCVPVEVEMTVSIEFK